MMAKLTATVLFPVPPLIPPEVRIIALSWIYARYILKIGRIYRISKCRRLLIYRASPLFYPHLGTSVTFQGRLTVSGLLQVLQEVLQSLAVKEDFEIIKE